MMKRAYINEEEDMGYILLKDCLKAIKLIANQTFSQLLRPFTALQLMTEAFFRIPLAVIQKHNKTAETQDTTIKNRKTQ